MDMYRRLRGWTGEARDQKSYLAEWRKNNPGYNAAWQKNNPDKVRGYRHTPKAKARRQEAHFRRKYGISTYEKDALFWLQGNKCAACNSSTPRGGRWHLDHCHVTNIIRGVICHSCNLALGLVGDSPKILQNLLEYL